MRYTGFNFEEVMEAHKRYIQDYPNGDKEDLATFLESDLSHMNLSMYDFSYAVFNCCDLQNTILAETIFDKALIANSIFRYSDISDSSFKEASITDSIFDCSNFEFTKFQQAKIDHTSFNNSDFHCAIFTNADVYYSSFNNANLCGTYFVNSSLSFSKFKFANLSVTMLNDTTFNNCDFKNASGIVKPAILANGVDIPLRCPDTGAFIGWKACHGPSYDIKLKDIYKMYSTFSNSKIYIVKLLIPEDAKRSSSDSNKCRCDKAIVLEIQDLFGNVITDDREVVSLHDPSFIYKKGRTVTPEDDFCEDRWEECSSGIHFFITREEAVDYVTKNRY